ncbi:MAG: hypothetical protein QM767_24645 [Anaeromyxobacter sp.]
MTTRRLPAVLVLAAGLLTAAPGRADLVDCHPARGFTVFLSEPPAWEGVFSARPGLERFMQRLQFELDTGAEAQWVNPAAEPVSFVICAHRAPATDGSEFAPPLVARLYNDRVLLEMWGTLLRSDPGAPPGVEAVINYLLVPVRFAADRGQAEMPGALQRLSYRAEGTQDFVKLITRPRDVDAFVALSLGYKLLREQQELEGAYRNLCRAAALLGRIRQRPMTAGTKAALERLRGFALASAAHTIDAAGAGERSGLLSLQDRTRPCAEELP